MIWAELLLFQFLQAAILKSKMAAKIGVGSRGSINFLKEHEKLYKCANFHTFFKKWTIRVKFGPYSPHYVH